MVITVAHDPERDSLRALGFDLSRLEWLRWWWEHRREDEDRREPRGEDS